MPKQSLKYAEYFPLDRYSHAPYLCASINSYLSWLDHLCYDHGCKSTASGIIPEGSTQGEKTYHTVINVSIMISSFNHFCFTPLLLENLPQSRICLSILLPFLIKTGQHHQHQTLQEKAELVDNVSKKIYHFGHFFGWVGAVPL